MRRSCRSAGLPTRSIASPRPDRNDFYSGDIARAIVADVCEAGGVLSAEDLARCRARIMSALAIPYRDAILQTRRG